MNDDTYAMLNGMELRPGKVMPEGVVSSISKDVILIDGFAGEKIMFCKQSGQVATVHKPVRIVGDPSKASSRTVEMKLPGGTQKVKTYSGNPIDILARARADREKRKKEREL